jgi:hypothetical protein
MEEGLSPGPQVCPVAVGNGNQDTRKLDDESQSEAHPGNRRVLIAAGM